jgi:hypothetical protein
MGKASVGSDFVVRGLSISEQRDSAEWAGAIEKLDIWGMGECCWIELRYVS